MSGWETVDSQHFDGFEARLERRVSDHHTSEERRWFLVFKPEAFDGAGTSGFGEDRVAISLNDDEAGYLLKYAEDA